MASTAKKFCLMSKVDIVNNIAQFALSIFVLARLFLIL